MFKELTTEEIEVRVWATIVLVLATILLISVVCILLAVTFVEQNPGEIAEIDKEYLSILKDIMLLCIGAVGGIVGRKGAYAAANLAKETTWVSEGPTPNWAKPKPVQKETE